jgi:hypothetical protein
MQVRGFKTDRSIKASLARNPAFLDRLRDNLNITTSSRSLLSEKNIDGTKIVASELERPGILKGKLVVVMYKSISFFFFNVMHSAK